MDEYGKQERRAVIELAKLFAFHGLNLEFATLAAATHVREAQFGVCNALSPLKAVA